MQLVKTVFCLAIFLLFVTLLAVTDDSNASGRSSSRQPASNTNYQEPYLREAKSSHMAPWLYEDWNANRYKTPERPNDAERILARFERTGLIKKFEKSKDGLPVITVGDLFLRLSDKDKNRVLQSFNTIISQHNNYKAGAYAIKHDSTNQHLGTLTSLGLQLQ